MTDIWTTRQVKELTGATDQQLHRWAVVGLIDGQGEVGSGARRRWTRNQIDRVRQLKAAFDLKASSIAELAASPVPRGLEDT